jgi:MFS superfamily sulfate permease-like transporter
MPLDIDTKHLSKDFVASIVVFLVALPLCMGIAIASGVPPAKGLLTGIVGGLIVGALAGSPLQVSGPAAGLTVIVYKLVQDHGLETLGGVLLIAGGIQIVAGLLKVGQWFRAISPAVIHGMLAGIGVLIFASQFHVMVDDLPRGSGLGNLLSIPEAIYKGIFPLDGSVHHQAAAIGLVTIASLLMWERMRPEPLKLIPGPLVAVIAGTLGAAWMGFDILRVDVPASLVDTIETPTTSVLASLMSPEMLIIAFSIAFIASAETLLCATAVDQMHDGPRTDYDRELTAQGVGNFLCGVMGALPMTGVIVRSSANVQAGGMTRMSAILHGAWLLLFVAAAPWLLRTIPTASLAAILVFTGYRLVNIAEIRKLAAFGRGEVGIYAVTLIGIVVADLLTGVLIGLALSIGKLLYTFSHLTVTTEVSLDESRADIHLEGASTFVRLPQLAAALDEIPQGTEVHVHVERLHYIDHACIELLANWEKQHQKDGATVVIEWNELHARYHRAGEARAEIVTRVAS